MDNSIEAKKTKIKDTIEKFNPYHTHNNIINDNKKSSSNQLLEILFKDGTRVSIGGFFSQANQAPMPRSSQDNLPVEDFYKSQNHLG